MEGDKGGGRGGFTIPMRGNEAAVEAITNWTVKFTIPMRGNEFGSPAGQDQQGAVYNPHEG